MRAPLPAYFDSTLSADDRVLLDRHLGGYLKLLDGRAESNTEARKHFLSVARGQAIPLTHHEAAFVRWQVLIGWREGPQPDTHVSEVQSKLASATAALKRSTSSAAANLAGWAKVSPSKAVTSVATWYNAMLSADTSTHLDRWMRETFTADSSIYDQAMDAMYAASGFGGPFHRIFDGGHDLAGAWAAVSAASSDDSFKQEVAGYLSALWNDVVTPMGLPIVTLDKAAFDQFSAQSEAFLGVSRSWLADAATVTATELAGVVLATLAVCLGWKSAEVEEVSRLAGSLVLSTAISANPLLLVIALVCLARSFQIARHGSDLVGLLSGVAQGGSGTAAFIVAASLASGPVWVSVLSGVVACVVALKLSKRATDQIAEIDWSQVSAMVLKRFRYRSQTPRTESIILLPGSAVRST